MVEKPLDEYGFREFAPNLWLAHEEPVMGEFLGLVEGPVDPEYGPCIIMELALIKGRVATSRPGDEKTSIVDGEPGTVYGYRLYSQVARDEVLRHEPAVGERVSLMSCGERLKRGFTEEDRGDPRKNATYHDIRVGWPDNPPVKKTIGFEEAKALRPIVKEALD